jgi:polyketide biosynthesis enoyl-CoA hydratase PksH
MEYETIKINDQQAIQRIQIYRPETNNTINIKLVQELTLALQTAEQDQEIKILVIEGLPDVFCTGMDLQEVIQKKEQVNFQPFYNNYYDILKQISQSNKIVISLVKGKVQAGGLGIVAASDVVISDDSATFVLSELLFGLLPACLLPFLIRRVGFQKAYRLALTTQTISVNDAFNWGLVDEYSSQPDRLLSQYLQRLKYLPLSGIKQLKNYMNKLWIIQQETQNLAVNTISELVTDSKIQENIKLYIEEGIFPWQR